MQGIPIDRSAARGPQSSHHHHHHHHLHQVVWALAIVLAVVVVVQGVVEAQRSDGVLLELVEGREEHVEYVVVRPAGVACGHSLVCSG